MKHITFIIIFMLSYIVVNAQAAKNYYNSGIASSLKGDHVNAILYFDSASILDPENDIIIYARGCSRMRLGDKDRATFDFNEAIRLNPYNHQAYFNLGVMAYEDNDFEKAKGFFTTSLNLNQTNIMALFSLSNIYYMEQDIDKAIDFYTETIKLDKSFNVLNKVQKINCFTYRSSAYSIKKEFDKALKDIEKVLEEEGNKNAHSFYLRAAIYFELKSYKKASEDIAQSLKLNPEFGYGYFFRAMVKNKLGDLQGAEADWATAEKYGYIKK